MNDFCMTELRNSTEERMLGRFTPAQLHAGGLNSRGIIQPILPTEKEDNRSSREELVRFNLLTPDPISTGRYKPAGVLAQILEMAAVARSVLIVELLGENPPPLPRIVFSRLGVTNLALDLRRDGDAYLCSSRSMENAVEAVSQDLGTDTLLQAVLVNRPGRPILQHKIESRNSDDRRWLRIGARLGEEFGSWAAPATPDRLQRVASGLIRGEQIAL